MYIFLTGATGFIGGAVLRALLLRGHTVTCLVRGRSADQLEAQELHGVRVVRGEFIRPETWVRHVAGHDAVINCVGMIRESKRAPFVEVHRRAPIALFEAASNAGVSKVIQVSAAGADAHAPSRYSRSKWGADQRLVEIGIPYVIFRPSIVYGSESYSMRLFLAMAAQPITPVPGDGEYQLQPIHVDDLVRAILIALEEPGISNITVEAGGAEPLSFNRLLDELARWLGRKKGAWKVPIPWLVMRLMARAGEFLGDRALINRDELEMLRRGNQTDNTIFFEQFGFEPVSLRTGLARISRSEEVRWRAGLAFLRLPLRLAIAFVWIYTGIISAFVYPVEDSLKMLERTGLTGIMASLALYSASLVDSVLGLALLFGLRIRLVGWLQLLVMVGYTVILSFSMPELWLHPFGALSKNIVFLMATLVLMALED